MVINIWSIIIYNYYLGFYLCIVFYLINIFASISKFKYLPLFLRYFHDILYLFRRVFFISSYSVVFFRQCGILTLPTVWYINCPDSVVFYLFRQCGSLTVPTVWNAFTVPTCAFLLLFFEMLRRCDIFFSFSELFRLSGIILTELWTLHLYVATFHQHLHTEYISLSWNDIPDLVVARLISLIEGCC
jgi:hypothetical protein